MATDPRNKLVAIRLTAAERQTIKVHAAVRGISMAEYLKLALAAFAASQPKMSGVRTAA